MTQSFADMSLDELKAQMASSADQAGLMQAYQDSFQQGSKSFVQGGDDTSRAQNRVRPTWEGRAKDSAMGSFDLVRDYMTQSSNASDESAATMGSLSNTTQEQNAQAQAIPDVKPDFGKSVAKHHGNPFSAISDYADDVDQANENHSAAVAQATAMDESGTDHANRLSAASWPTADGSGGDVPIPADPPPLFFY